MTDWDRHHNWMEETSKVEKALRKELDGWYISIGLNHVSLDGSFTPEGLRRIADVVEERIKAVEDA